MCSSTKAEYASGLSRAASSIACSPCAPPKPAAAATWANVRLDRLSLRVASRAAVRAPAMAREPLQERPNRVGSSLLNMMTSMLRFGEKPARRSDATAWMPPSTPRTPSKRPLRGMASVCDPVPTAGSCGSLPTHRPKMVPNESSLQGVCVRGAGTAEGAPPSGQKRTWSRGQLSA